MTPKLCSNSVFNIRNDHSHNSVDLKITIIYIPYCQNVNPCKFMDLVVTFILIVTHLDVVCNYTMVLLGSKKFIINYCYVLGNYSDNLSEIPKSIILQQNF
ncbi:conserved hypothetical protein [Cotesia vestalis bracovirus]|nr:conserved hypothetical protein [Cotesia vestalis bracovirus]